MGFGDLRRVGGLLAMIVLCAGVFGAGVARGEDDVLVNITGPLAGKVGDRVSFDVELVNRSGRALEKLRVVDYFDAGFHHEASKSPVEMKGTIDLAAGTARRITLDFLLDEPGRQCHRVEILDQSHRFIGGATECVQVAAVATTAPPAATNPPPLIPPPAVVPPQVVAAAPAFSSVSLDLVGPAEATSGSAAAFVVTVRNTGDKASQPAKLSLGWDQAFVPLEGSDGFAREGARVSWNLPPIEAGGQAVRQLVLRAEAPAAAYADSDPVRACVHAELTGIDPPLLGDQECVLIRSTTPRPRLRSPSEAGLRLALADLDDPVRQGDATTLVCTVSNDGATASGQLSIAIDLPRGARLVGDSRSRVDGGRVFFDAVDVPAGRQQSVEVSYKAADPGRTTASATLTGAGLDGRLERSCTTEFLP